MAFDEQHAIDSLAVILHSAGGGTLGQAPTTDQYGQLGQQYLDAATQQASPGSATSTTTVPGTMTTGSADGSIVDPVPEGTGVTQGYGGPGGHPGIDLGVPLDTQLLAAQSGTVTQAENDDPNGTHTNDFGDIVTITTADGYQIRYGHLHGMNVKVGDKVSAGQVIGSSGGEKGGPTSGNSEGPHLHFEVRGPDGQTVDPTPWLAGGHAITTADPSKVTTSIASPDQQMGATIGNIMDVAAGKSPSHATEMKTTTTPGATHTTGAAGAVPASKGDSDPASVDAFLAATRQHESNNNYQARYEGPDSDAAGAYQFISTTWKGVGGSTASAADASPEEQDRVARAYALQLFNELHSWRLVAIAWFGGPGVAEQVAAGQDPGPAPGGQGSYTAYGDLIQQMMAGGTNG